MQAACEFLDGQCDELQAQLEGEMQKAAAAQDYEKAAQLRDAVVDLRHTTRKTTRFERTPWNLPVAVMPERDNLELGKVLGLPGPPERIEGFDISNISGTLKVASVVSFRRGRPDRANYRRMKIQVRGRAGRLRLHGGGGATALHPPAAGGRCHRPRQPPTNR